jgi:hypothetical protein
MVCLAQGSHHLALHIFPALGALGPELLLVVTRTVVGTVLVEVATLGERVLADWRERRENGLVKEKKK